MLRLVHANVFARPSDSVTFGSQPSSSRDLLRVEKTLLLLTRALRRKYRLCIAARRLLQQAREIDD